MPMPCEDHWQSRAASSPFQAAVSFDGDDLVLGSRTVLYKLGAVASGTISLRPDAAHDRMVALLAVAGRGRVAKAALAQLAVALDDWRRGDRGLAAIRLVFAPLPRLRDGDDAYRLFLAETALDAGLSPNDLLKELGYSACTPLLKFDPNQPRVPAGSGARSGQWTSGSTGGGTSGTTAVPGSFRIAPEYPEPGPRATEPIRPTPVFFRPEDPDTHTLDDKWRRFGADETDEERIEEGRPLRPPIPGPIGPSSPGLIPDLADPAAPETGTVPILRLTPAPGGGAPPPDAPPHEKGPACPPQEDDVPNGPSPSGDENEYAMSFRINPLNSTPKYSMATPDVVSQAYFLPSPTPRGRTSFDDCKQDDTPALLNIPGLKPGDLFELKAPDWGWFLFYPNLSGFKGFETQVKNQNAAVVAEGRGRQIYYCLGTQAVADRAASAFSTLTNSHFLVCH